MCYVYQCGLRIAIVVMFLHCYHTLYGLILFRYENPKLHPNKENDGQEHSSRKALKC